MQEGVAVTRNSLRLVAIFLALCASTNGRAWEQVTPHVSFSHCRSVSHTEAYPRNPHWKRAYGCKSDMAGYLEGPAQGDEMRN
jgi:hypothetical protein